MDRPFDYIVPESLTVAPGSLVRVPFGGRRVRAVTVRVDERAPERELAEIAGLVAPVPVCPPPLTDVVEWIARRYVSTRGQAFARVVPPRVRVSVGAVQSPTGRPGASVVPALTGGPRLLSAIESGSGGVWCLRRGAGQDGGAIAADLVAAAGRGRGSALVAVPEVRYGSPALDALAHEWPDMARVDIATEPAERARGLLKLASGHGVGGGGRAAVLAPAPELRVLVVDDAHHPSYKEDRSPRYDARRVAVERARLQGAVCVFVSPTPPVEIGAAARRGRINWIEPTRTEDRQQRPVVELLPPQQDRAITHQLHARMRDELRAGGRVGILAQRRGYSRALWCAACHRSLRCPRCEAGLFFHRFPRPSVRCARCGLTDPPPDKCPTCEATQWQLVGAGSERLAEQLTAAFPRARVARVDPEVLAESSPDELDLDAADIYVTTWVGTKPTVRPDVTLVAVIDADALIRRPDFRAAERAYQALAEMAEWAGPASDSGRLVVQTAEPSHHAVQAIARADYGYFLDRELEERKELGYPPFSELVKVAAVGDNRNSAIERVADLCRKLGASVLGPITTGSGERLEILVKHPRAMDVADALREMVANAQARARLQVDVDPR